MMGSLDVVQLPFALGCYQVRTFLTVKVSLSEGRRKYRGLGFHGLRLPGGRAARLIVSRHVFLPH